MTSTEQLDLFDQPRDRVADLAAGQAAADAGSALALDAAEHWKIVANEVLDELIEKGEEFTADDIADRVGIPADHPNAMGGLFSAASKQLRIVPVRTTKATRKESHARRVCVWKKSDPDAAA